MVFILHGAVALYHIGHVGAAGRALNAHNLILWHAIQKLRRKGIRSLDLGGLDTVDNRVSRGSSWAQGRRSKRCAVHGVDAISGEANLLRDRESRQNL